LSRETSLWEGRQVGLLQGFEEEIRFSCPHN
jgi:hypothetical protein